MGSAMYIYRNEIPDGNLAFLRYDSYTFHTIPHVHREIELVYVLRGSVDVVVDGSPYVAQTGDCIMILPLQIHFYNSKTVASTVVVNFTGSLVSSFIAEIGNSTVDRNVFAPDRLTELLIQKYLVDGDPHTVYEQKCVLYATCNAMLKSVRLKPREYPEHAPAYRVIRYVSDHYRENMSLQEISAALGYEYHYLSRMFNRITGSSFRDFLNCLRIEYARSMLRNTQTSVSQIALEAGYQNIRSFNRIFKEVIGLSPTEYRCAEDDGCLPAGNGASLSSGEGV